MLNFYKIENNYPMTYSGDKPLDESWKEFTVTDGIYAPTELNDAMLALDKEQKLSSKINEAKQYLLSTDYKMTIDYFATMSAEQQEEVIRLRSEAREYIRENYNGM